MEIKKLLAIGIIFLFIGVAVAPSINSSFVKASKDNDLVEVTSQACGISRFENNQKKTVSLSEVEYQQLDAYLTEFQSRLNASCSLDETKSLFKEALQKLNSFGLIPHGVSPELVYSRICRNLPKHIPGCTIEFGRNQVKNYCCLVTGKATMVRYDRLILALLASIVPANLLVLLPVVFYYIPAGIGLVVSLGLWYYYVYFPSVGTIYTYGVNGQYSNNGSLWGTLPLPWFYFGFSNCAPALLGFTGVHLYLPKSGPNEEDFFIGFTLIASYNMTASQVGSIS
jgi:hypothetical protein